MGATPDFRDHDDRSFWHQQSAEGSGPYGQDAAGGTGKLLGVERLPSIREKVVLTADGNEAQHTLVRPMSFVRNHPSVTARTGRST